MRRNSRARGAADRRRARKRVTLSAEAAERERGILSSLLVLRHRFPEIRTDIKKTLAYGRPFVGNFQHSLYKFNRGSHGKTFLIDLRSTYFESPLCVALLFNSAGEKGLREERAFEARLSFEKGGVLIRALQGTRNIVEIRQFERLVGMPVANYMVLEIEQQAKMLGYKRVKLPNPTALEAYKNPNFYTSLRYRGKTLFRKKMEGELTHEEELELNKILNTTKEKVKERINSLYTSVALSLGYRESGRHFVKEL
jgi:hypothetical protein